MSEQAIPQPPQTDRASATLEGGETSATLEGGEATGGLVASEAVRPLKGTKAGGEHEA